LPQCPARKLKKKNGRYVPNAAGAVYDVLKEMAQSHALKRKRYEDEDADLLDKVSARLITKDMLTEKLSQHVEKVIHFNLLVKYF